MINREVIQNINKHTEDIKNLGSSLETMEKKTSWYVNVKNFGAKGDGITDDSPAFQRAINYMFETDRNGGRLYVPKGKYLFNTPVNTAHDSYSSLFGGTTTSGNFWANGNGRIQKISIIGDSEDNTIFICGSNNLYIFDVDVPLGVTYNFYCEEISFLGIPEKANPGKSDIKAGSTPFNFNKSKGLPKNVEFKNCSSNLFDHGIEYDRFKGATGTDEIMRMKLHNVKTGYNNVGFYCGGDDTVLEDCRCERNYEFGAVFNRGTQVTIKNSKIQGNGDISDNSYATGQIKIIGTTVFNIENLYLENRSSKIENNYTSALIVLDSGGSTSYSYNFHIDKCYINGMGAKKIFHINDTVVLKGVRISNTRLRNFYVDDKTLINVSSPSSIYDFAFDNVTFEEIYNSSDKTLIPQDEIIIINAPSLKRNNSRTSFNINTSPSINANGGCIVNVFGSVSSTASKWHGGEWFTVEKTSTGVYSITILNKENISTSGGNKGIFPVVVTPISTKNVFAIVEFKTVSNFVVRIRDITGTAVDESFHFMTSMVVK